MTRLTRRSYSIRSLALPSAPRPSEEGGEVDPERPEPRHVHAAEGRRMEASALEPDRPGRRRVVRVEYDEVDGALAPRRVVVDEHGMVQADAREIGDEELHGSSALDLGDDLGPDPLL